MKYYTSLLLAASLSTVALVPVMAQPASPPKAQASKPQTSKPQDDLYKSLQVTIRARRYPEAVTQAKQALKIDDLLISDKIRFLTIAADASMRQTPTQYAQAKSFYEQIIADPAIVNSDKVDALNNLSNAYIASLRGQYLDKMDSAPAYAILNRALQLPNLQPEDRASALKTIGSLYEQEDKYAKAIATYQDVAKLDVSEQTRTGAQQLIAGVYASQGQVGKVISLYRKYNLDFIPLYKRLNDYNLTPRFKQSADIGKAHDEMFKILDNPTVPDKDRWSTFRSLEIWAGRARNQNYPLMRKQLVDIQKVTDKYLPSFLETDPNRTLVLLNVFKSPATPVFQNDVVLRSLANPGFIVWAAPLLLKAPKLSDKDYAFVKQKQTNALMALGNISQAIAELQAIEADQRVDAATRFWAQLTLAMNASRDSDILKTVQQENGLDKKVKAETIIDAAQTVLLAGNDHAANTLYSAYEAMLPQQSTATIDCAFTPNAPSDVGSWLASPLLQDTRSTAKLDRPYGDNLKFLVETDASTTGRDAGAQSDKSTGDTVTNFYIACDARGIHFFFDAHDSHAMEVLDGLVRGGSFEMYLAPGKDQAYYTFLPRLPEGKITTGPGAFITMYPNSSFRLPSTGDGTLRNSILLTEDGFGMSLFMSWELFYDKLPTNGTNWQFEAIRWTRSGGRSFGGSESVHNRSSWGDIVFSGLTPENLIAIKRAIVFKALAKYKSVNKVTDPAHRWNDPELGDPSFYQSQIVPLLARLDKYTDMVNQNMTSADVETIFNEAVPGWMAIDYRVAALRTKYLENNLFVK